MARAPSRRKMSSAAPSCGAGLGGGAGPGAAARRRRAGPGPGRTASRPAPGMASACVEQGGRLVVRGGDGRRPGRDQGQPRRDAGQADLAHDRDVGGRLSVTAGADRGLDEVEGDPERMRDVGGEGPGRADRDGLLVGALEITLTHRGQRPDVARAGLHRAAATRPGPAGYLVGELLGRVVIAAPGGQQRLAVLQQPGQQPVAVRPAETRGPPRPAARPRPTGPPGRRRSRAASARRWRTRRRRPPGRRGSLATGPRGSPAAGPRSPRRSRSSRSAPGRSRWPAARWRRRARRAPGPRRAPDRRRCRVHRYKTVGGCGGSAA